MTQPEALRLADELERDKWHVPAVVMQAAADELRRLHQLALDQQGEIYTLNMARSMEQKTAALKAKELERCKQVCAATSEGWRSDTDVWKAQRDALLEALKTVEWHGGGSCWVVDADKIAAAIKAAEKNT